MEKDLLNATEENEVVNEMKDAIDESIEQQEETVQGLEELVNELSADKTMRELANDLADINKIDKKNINKLKDFKQYVDISSGMLNINNIMSNTLMDTHSNFMNKTMEEDDLLKSYFEEIFVETDKDDKSFYKIKVNEKYYTIKQEFLTKIEDSKYTDYMNIDHYIILRDMNKISKHIYQVLGETPQTKDLLIGCDIIYNEISNLIINNFSEEKMVNDVSTSYEYFFSENKLYDLAKDTKKEIKKEMDNADDKKYIKDRTISRHNLTNGIITKINKASHNLKHGEGARFVKCITDFAFVIAYINELDDLSKENVISKLDDVNDQIIVDKFFSYERMGIESAMLRHIKKHILDKKGVTYIPALVNGMTYDVENNPMIDYAIKICEKLKEID